MNGECNGFRVRTEGEHVEKITAIYTPSGIINVKIMVSNAEGQFISFGNDEIEASYKKVSEWEFSEDIVFVGLETWQTASAIHQLRIITMDTQCVSDFEK